jgi:hypothetical protein
MANKQFFNLGLTTDLTVHAIALELRMWQTAIQNKDISLSVSMRFF